MDEDINIKPTGSLNVFMSLMTKETKKSNSICLFLAETGRLMARFCVAFETMKVFAKVAGTENLSDLVGRLLIQHNAIRLGSCKRKFYMLDAVFW